MQSWRTLWALCFHKTLSTHQAVSTQSLLQIVSNVYCGSFFLYHSDDGESSNKSLHAMECCCRLKHLSLRACSYRDLQPNPPHLLKLCASKILLLEKTCSWNVQSCCCPGKEGPNSLQMEVRLKIGSGNMVLEGDQRLKIARAGMQGLTLTAHKYPVTLGVSLTLDGVGLLSPEGTIARAGQELQQEEVKTALDTGEQHTSKSSRHGLQGACDSLLTIALPLLSSITQSNSLASLTLTPPCILAQIPKSRVYRGSCFILPSHILHLFASFRSFTSAIMHAQVCRWLIDGLFATLSNQNLAYRVIARFPESLVRCARCSRNQDRRQGYLQPGDDCGIHPEAAGWQG